MLSWYTIWVFRHNIKFWHGSNLLEIGAVRSWERCWKPHAVRSELILSLSTRTSPTGLWSERSFRSHPYQWHSHSASLSVCSIDSSAWFNSSASGCNSRKRAPVAISMATPRLRGLALRVCSVRRSPRWQYRPRLVEHVRTGQGARTALNNFEYDTPLTSCNLSHKPP